MEEYMFSLLVDSFLDYMEATEEIDRDTYWYNLATNPYTGRAMDDKFFVFTYADEVFNEQVLDAAYTYLLDKDYPKDYPLEQLVPYLANRYYILKYNELKDSVMSSVEDDEVAEIIKKFKEDYDYGMEIVKGYYDSFMHNNQYNCNANRINECNDHEVVVKLNKAYMDVSIQTLNEILRGVIVNLFNHYVNNGYDNKGAIEMTWLYFTENFDPLGELDRMGVDVLTKMQYKRLMLGLIYGDLLEDFRKEEVEQMVNYDDRLMACIPAVVGNLGMLSVPNNEEVRIALLERFIFLQDDEERKISNRRHSYEIGLVDTLKNLNPYYILDELKFKTKS